MSSEVGNHMRAPIRRLGNSAGILLPKPVLAELGVGVGDDLALSLEKGRAVLEPVRRRPRTGWAKAARQIAVARDDSLVWPEFSNADDRNLAW